MKLRLAQAFTTILVLSASYPAQAQWNQELANMHRAIKDLARSGQMNAAIDLAKKALHRALEIYGPNHKYISTRLNNLAILYKRTGQFDKAEPLYLRSLRLRFKLLPRGHVMISTGLANLGSLYMAQERYTKAIPLATQALSLREEALGGNHFKLSGLQGNLAVVIDKALTWAREHNQHTEVLAAIDKASRAPNISISSLSILAERQLIAGILPLAESTFKRLLRRLARGEGKSALKPGAVAVQLAHLYVHQGRFIEAEAMYERGLHTHKLSPKSKEADEVTALIGLSEVYRSTSRSEKAVALLTRSKTIIEATSGKDSPQLSVTLNNLGANFEALNEFSKAEQSYQYAVRVHELQGNPNSPSIATPLNNLARLLKRRGKVKDAEELTRRSLAIDKQAIGEHHFSYGFKLSNLADLVHLQGRGAEAEALYRRSIAIIENDLNAEHFLLRTPLRGLSKELSNAGKSDESRMVQQRLDQMPRDGARHLSVFYATTRNLPGRPLDRTTVDTHKTNLGKLVVEVPAPLVRAQGHRRSKGAGIVDLSQDPLSAAGSFEVTRSNALQPIPFFNAIEKQAAKSGLYGRQVLLFVHGFNVDFNEASKRLAQIAFDLEFDGTLIAFSWDSLGQSDPLSYRRDIGRADTAVDAFVSFLDRLSSALPDMTIHIIAHSMGNRILAKSMQAIAARKPIDRRPRIGEIILAHADIDPEWCRNVGQVRPHVRGITNYVNRDDWALWVAKGLRLGKGRCGRVSQAYPGIQTIDTTGMGGKRSGLLSVLLGAKNHHGVFANDPLLFGEITRLILTGQRPPHQRTVELTPRRDQQGKVFWSYSPEINRASMKAAQDNR